MRTLDPNPGPPLTFAVHLSTVMGPLYVASSDAVAADLRAQHPDTPVLSRSEIDGILSIACRIAPPNYLRLTLWRELHALLALKRALPCGTATFQEPGSHTGHTVTLEPDAQPPDNPPAPEPVEQLELPC